MSHSCYSSCTVGALSWRVELVTGSEGASWQCVETAVRRCVVEEGFLAASQLLLGAVCSDEAPKDLAALANSAPRPVAPGATARRAGGCGLCPGSHLGVHALVTPLRVHFDTVDVDALPFPATLSPEVCCARSFKVNVCTESPQRGELHVRPSPPLKPLRRTCRHIAGSACRHSPPNQRAYWRSSRSSSGLCATLRRAAAATARRRHRRRPPRRTLPPPRLRRRPSTTLRRRPSSATRSRRTRRRLRTTAAAARKTTARPCG